MDFISKTRVYSFGVDPVLIIWLIKYVLSKSASMNSVLIVYITPKGEDLQELNF